MVKTIEKAIYLLSIMFLLWVALSYIEILSKQLLGGATYSDYNIITNLLHYYKIMW